MVIERGVTYRLLVDDKDRNGKWFVQIIDGLYTGLLYRYIRFQFSKDENEDGTKHLRFQYEVLEVPEHLEGIFLPDECEGELKKLLGDILIQILDDYFSDSTSDEISLDGGEEYVD